LKIKELIDNGMLGDIRTVNIEMYQPLKDFDIDDSENWRVVPEIACGGYFHDLASHQLDYLDFLFGKLTTAYGISANQAHAYISDDIVTAAFQFENGVIGTGNWCFTTDKISDKDNITIVGSKGELSFNCFGTPMIINLKSSLGGNEQLIYDHQQPIQEPMIQLIVDELRGIGISPSYGISGARKSNIS
jgi:predicted dehydrogenase